jgi:hypothetical protein
MFKNISELPDSKNLKLISKYLNKFNDAVDRVDFMYRLGITEQNSTLEYQKLINCKLFNYRYRYFNICERNKCINFNVCFEIYNPKGKGIIQKSIMQLNLQGVNN